MAKTSTNQGSHWADISFDEILPELGKRARHRNSDIIECLGKGARTNPDDAFIAVIVAAWSYRRFDALHRSAPTRRFLHTRLTKLRDAVRTAGKILGSNDGFLLAALSLGGLPEEEARALRFGSGSKLQSILSALDSISAATLALSGLTGPASGQKALAEGPKTALAIRCARIFEKY